MKMKDAVTELMANESIYSDGPTVIISDQAARGVLRYIRHLERKIQKQKEEIVRCKRFCSDGECK
jgi:hypothetical protein